MLISFIFRYLENIFVVFYLSFYFILAQNASTHATEDLPSVGRPRFLTNSTLSKRVHMKCMVLPWRPESCQFSHKDDLFYPFVIVTTMCFLGYLIAAKPPLKAFC